MKSTTDSLLLCTNGAKEGFAALEYGVWLAALFQSAVTLVGVIENPGRRKAVEQALAETETRLKTAGITYQTQLLLGDTRSILREFSMERVYLVVLGPLRRSSWKRWLRGRSFRRIAAILETPFLYVPAPGVGLKHILVCLGGLGYARDVIGWAIRLAALSQAEITFLHVVEPIGYDYPIAREIQENWERIQETDTPQGSTLRHALEDARSAGVHTTLKICRGAIVHEILSEVHAGEYDLIAMGLPGESNSLRHYFMPNVTAEVAESISIPVLTSHHRLA